jgi:flavin-dependent thymidylate synthase
MTDDNVTNLPIKWADEAMFEAEPINDLWQEEYGVVPDVKLLWMTPAPLSAMAAMNLMYEGKVIRSLEDVTEEEARRAMDDMTHTHLPAPMEAVKFHFVIEGADRAFQQQLTRQRTAVYAGESLRFAVIDDLVHGTSLPPSVFGTKQEVSVAWWPLREMPSVNQEQRWRDLIDVHARITSDIYSLLVNDGMPAEDARGILPLSTATRIEYITDLRNLTHHAGNRLCTQAQYHWRLIFHKIVQCIKKFQYDQSVRRQDMWQFDELSASTLFRPVCYQLGHCPFKASIDRACKIRTRVDANAAYGRPSSEWSEPYVVADGDFGPDIAVRRINDTEWLFDPSAARQKGGK